MTAASLSRLTLRASVVPAFTLSDRLTQLVRSSEHDQFHSDVFDRFCVADFFGLNILMGGKGLTNAILPIADCEYYCVGFCRREDRRPLSRRQISNLQTYLELLVPSVQLACDDLSSKSPLPAFITIPASHSGTFNDEAQRQAYLAMLFLSECDLQDLMTRPPTVIRLQEPEAKSKQHC